MRRTKFALAIAVAAFLVCGCDFEIPGFPDPSAGTLTKDSVETVSVPEAPSALLLIPALFAVIWIRRRRETA